MQHGPLGYLFDPSPWGCTALYLLARGFGRQKMESQKTLLCPVLPSERRTALNRRKIFASELIESCANPQADGSKKVACVAARPVSIATAEQRYCLARLVERETGSALAKLKKT